MRPTEEESANIQKTANRWFIDILRQKTPNWPWTNSRVKTESEEVVIETALSHGILAMCSHLLLKTEAWETIPTSLQKKLLAYLRNEAATEMAATYELNIVLNKLAENNIFPLLIKGVTLGYCHYPKPYLRTRCDTDLLFLDKKTTIDAWEILQAIGYHRPNAIQGEFISYEFTCVKKDKLGVTHALDCHWAISNHHLFSSLLPYDELFQNSIIVKEISEYAYGLNNVYSLLFICMHLIVHRAEGIDDRLIWTYDVHLLCNSFTEKDWKSFIRLSVEKKVCSICLDRVTTTKKILGTTIPTYVIEQLSAHSTGEMFKEGIGESQIGIMYSNFKVLPGWKARLCLLKEHFFPAGDYMLNKYNTSLKPLLPFLYLLRTIQGIYKIFKSFLA